MVWEIRTSEVDPNEFLAHNTPLDDNPITAELGYLISASTSTISDATAYLANYSAISSICSTISNIICGIGVSRSISAESFTVSSSIGLLAKSHVVSSVTSTVSNSQTSIILKSIVENYYNPTKTGIGDDQLCFVIRILHPKPIYTITQTSARNIRIIIINSSSTQTIDNNYGYITVDGYRYEFYLQIDDGDDWLAIRNDLEDYLFAKDFPKIIGESFTNTSSYANINRTHRAEAHTYTITDTYALAYRQKYVESETFTITDDYGSILVIRFRLIRIIDPVIELIYDDKNDMTIIYDDKNDMTIIYDDIYGIEIIF